MRETEAKRAEALADRKAEQTEVAEQVARQAKAQDDPRKTAAAVVAKGTETKAAEAADSTARASPEMEEAKKAKASADRHAEQASVAEQATKQAEEQDARQEAATITEAARLEAQFADAKGKAENEMEEEVLADSKAEKAEAAEQAARQAKAQEDQREAAAAAIAKGTLAKVAEAADATTRAEREMEEEARADRKTEQAEVAEQVARQAKVQEDKRQAAAAAVATETEAKAAEVAEATARAERDMVEAVADRTAEQAEVAGQAARHAKAPEDQQKAATAAAAQGIETKAAEAAEATASVEHEMDEAKRAEALAARHAKRAPDAEQAAKQAEVQDDRLAAAITAVAKRIEALAKDGNAKAHSVPEYVTKLFETFAQQAVVQKAEAVPCRGGREHFGQLPKADQHQWPPHCAILPMHLGTINAHDFDTLQVLDQCSIVSGFDGSDEAWRSLTTLLCHLLKVGQPWDAVVDELRMTPFFEDEAPDALPSKDLLFLWLLHRADGGVRRRMLGLQLVHNPVPLKTEWPDPGLCEEPFWSMPPTPRVWTELFWSMPELPLLLSVSFDTAFPGISMLANGMFATDFQATRVGMDGYVQVQFATDFQQPGRGYAVALAHGTLVNDDFLIDISKYFQFFVIHAAAERVWEHDFQEAMRELSSAPRSRQVFVLAMNSTCSKVTEATPYGATGKVCVFNIPESPWESESNHIKKLRRIVNERIAEHLQYKACTTSALAVQAPGNVAYNPEQSSVFSKKDFLALSNADFHGLSIVESLVKKAGQSPTYFDGCLTMEPPYRQFCEAERLLKLAQVHEDRHRMQEFLLQRERARTEMKQAQQSSVASEFSELLLSVMPDAYLHELRQRLAKHFDPAGAQRAMDALHHELIHLITQGTSMVKPHAQRLTRAYAELVWRGAPFEVVDGDNLHFPADFLQAVFTHLEPRTRGKSFMVESVIGPQSSGKSTLKNHKYGCNFGVSEGRCSRGIYGQLVVSKEAVVLILDTEGLQSIEKDSPEFDRLVTLFTLATSDLIDINVKGMMNEPFKRLIGVCVRALYHLEMAKVPSPKIRWVINQVADPDPRHHYEGFRRLKSELAETFENDHALLKELVQLDETDITVMPSKYSSTVVNTFSSRWTRLLPSHGFAEKCADELACTLQGLTAVANRPNRPFDDMLTWISVAHTIFMTITRYPDLTYFGDVKQVKHEKILRQLMGNLMAKQFDEATQAKSHREGLDSICREETGLTSAMHRMSKLFEDAFGGIIEDFEREARYLKCDPSLVKRLRRVLDFELEAKRLEWEWVVERFFREEEDKQWKYFRSAVLQDESADQQQAARFVEVVEQHLWRHLSTECRGIAAAIVEKKRVALTRQEIQTHLDQCLGSDDLDLQVRYIGKPVKVLKEEFEKRFVDIQDAVESKVRPEVEAFKDRLKSLSTKTASLLASVEKEKGQSSLMFTVESETGDPNLTQQLTRQATAKYFVAYLLADGMLPSKWHIADEEGSGKDRSPYKVSMMPNSLPATGNPVSEGVLRDALQASKCDTLSVSNLHHFLEGVQAELSMRTSCFDVRVPQCEEVVADARTKYEGMLVPCEVVCECCGRLCDNSDMGPGHVHRCSQGHQIRGFTGIHLEDDKRTASTRICSQIEDDDEFVDKHGKRMTWRKYKAEHPEWDFLDHYDNDRYDREARMLRAWRKVGEHFCKFYGTFYTEFGEQGSVHRPPLHFLLVVDSSGSMSGRKWLSLQDAARGLVHECQRHEKMTRTHRFSLVSFDDASKEHFAFLDSATALLQVQHIDFTGGGTRYIEAFQGAGRLLRNNAPSHSYHRHVLVFMSDGLDHFGGGLERTLNNFKQEFGATTTCVYCIGFGDECDFETLRRVAKALNGKYVNSPTDIDPINSFAEIAQRCLQLQ